MKRHVKRLSVIGTLFLIVFVFISGQASPQSEIGGFPRDERFELQVISELNRFRIRDGRVPLVRNPDLDYLAQIQAEYMARYMPFTDVDPKTFDYHIDAFGDGVQKRADFIGWPAYGIPGDFYVAEIAAYYPSVDSMMDFWNSSPEHRNSIYQYGFREVGVAVVRNREWRLAYVVFGGRPRVLPVLYWPDRNMLFLTSDQSPFPEHFVPAQVQIINDQGQRLHDEEWLLWRPRMTLPAGATNNFTVIFTDGVSEVVTDVDLSASRIFPSDPLVTPVPTPTHRP
ncbi:MAG: CAP domain-containing protein, partial [Anaerolineae bacterium]|nr:CAP domain-containing protein [Anaerolineae bacterium]